jgi:replication factor C subunit 3/5
MTGDLKIAKPDWESYCQKVADLIVAEQSPARVIEVRTKLYELLSHCIPPTVVLKACLCFHSSYSKLIYTIYQTIAERVTDKVDEAIKSDIMHWAAFYVHSPSLSCRRALTNQQEVRMRIGQKKIFHLEAWVIKVMSIQKVWLHGASWPPLTSYSHPEFLLRLSRCR